MRRAASPRARTPVPAAGSFRRTSHVAAGPQDGHDYGDGVEAPRAVSGRCRDVIVGTAGLTVVAEARLEACVDTSLAVTALALDPGSVPAGAVGASAVRGWQRRVMADAADADGPGTRALLDLAIGASLAGYARMQAGRLAGRPRTEMIRAEQVDRLADTCAGWAADGSMVVSLRDGTYTPPALPPEVPDGDRDGWHDLGDLPPGWIRRRRRIDVHDQRIEAAFRDSYVDPAGSERSLHEWELVIELADDRIAAIDATPRSLPFGECPMIAGNVERLRGTPLGSLREAVRADLAGVAGCTHLNDLLGSVPAAVAAAARAH